MVQTAVVSFALNLRNRSSSQGAWQVIARETSGQQEGVASLEEASWHILAQYKLRDYPAAQEALVQLAGHDPAAHASLSSSSEGL